jgi:hypothetical protein
MPGAAIAGVGWAGLPLAASWEGGRRRPLLLLLRLRLRLRQRLRAPTRGDAAAGDGAGRGGGGGPLLRERASCVKKV